MSKSEESTIHFAVSRLADPVEAVGVWDLDAPHLDPCTPMICNNVNFDLYWLFYILLRRFLDANSWCKWKLKNFSECRDTVQLSRNLKLLVII